MNKLSKKHIIDFCEDLGLDTIGFTSCRNFNIEGNTIISIVFPYLYNETNTEVYFSKYTQGLDYHKVLENYLDKICKYIQSAGGTAIQFRDNNSLPERHIAALSGNGFIGRNGMLITERYGSYVFLGEIITDIYFDEDRAIQDNCSNCSACREACPAGAILQGGGIEETKCLSYISQKKHITDEEMYKLKGRLFGCDTCQRVCPKNKNKYFSKIPEFIPLDYMENPNIKELIYMDNSIFKDKYKKVSCSFKGKNILIRNALISEMLYKGNKDVFLNCENHYIKEYYNRLLYL